MRSFGGFFSTTGAVAGAEVGAVAGAVAGCDVGGTGGSGSQPSQTPTVTQPIIVAAHRLIINTKRIDSSNGVHPEALVTVKESSDKTHVQNW